ncbi:hypothetical protein QAD02_005418 [Eretmocerus hayati]|uniref:Uncharacterized protein n=1 Tax=Eretmocerus hayati TaxID=131215 RepID=A0ACC2NU65_9HYME|nr:hypothetical protein QAD02_005418 [Eretmocerus hayati]
MAEMSIRQTHVALCEARSQPPSSLFKMNLIEGLPLPKEKCLRHPRMVASQPASSIGVGLIFDRVDIGSPSVCEAAQHPNAASRRRMRDQRPEASSYHRERERPAMAPNMLSF